MSLIEHARLDMEERYSHLNIGRQVLRVVKVGDVNDVHPGAWMDEKLALKFAAWPAPRFELWVFDKICQAEAPMAMFRGQAAYGENP